MSDACNNKKGRVLVELTQGELWLILMIRERPALSQRLIKGLVPAPKRTEVAETQSGFRQGGVG